MKSSESGHALLYTTVFFPLVLGGAALAFDISGINLKSERAQTSLDSLVLDSAHFLPDSEAVKRNFKKSIDQIDGKVSKFEVVTNELNSKVIARIVIEERTLILPMLLTAFGLTSSNQTRQVTSEAELLPSDLAVVLSDGVDQRPWSDSEMKSQWPEDQGIGTASSALTSCILPSIRRYSNFKVPKVWFESSQWITQTCFNPVFSAFKLTAMNIASASLAVGTNRAAVVFTPGMNGLGETIRHGTHISENDLDYYGYSKPGKAPLASWIPYKDLEYELGDEACIVFSDLATAAGGEYSIDAFTGRALAQRECRTPIANAKCGQPFSIGESDR